ncbi:hypothetical protein BDZ89DRAFT_1161671 [Hymenopellis radicata]|nr:hypothetical protein BDZ89DRAFT_1161671 [Hymenopellis radicata]
MSAIFNFLSSVSWSWGPPPEPLDATPAPTPPAEPRPPPLKGVERVMALNNAMGALCATGRVHRQLAELIYNDPMFTGLSPRCSRRHALYLALTHELSCPSTSRRDPPPKRYLPGQEPVLSHPSAPRPMGGRIDPFDPFREFYGWDLPDGPQLPPAQFNTSEYFAHVYPIPRPDEARLWCSVPYGPADPNYRMADADRSPRLKETEDMLWKITHAPPSMSKEERQRLIDEFLYEHSLRRDLKRRRERRDSGDSDEGDDDDGDDDGHRSRRRRYDYTLR